MFDYREPVYFVRDLELVKLITIKNFEHFKNRWKFFNVSTEPLFQNSLLFLEGHKWKTMRSTLSPEFTGSKMRNMFELIAECADGLAQHLLDESKGGKPLRWDMKKLSSFFTNDVIASCAFGLKIDSVKDPKNEFYTLGKNQLDFSRPSLFVPIVFIRWFPNLMKKIGLRVFSSKANQFFGSMILDTMKVREKNGIVRPDMINILMQVRKAELNQNGNGLQDKPKWTDDEIVAQCFFFFFAGYETVSSLISFTCYELALNKNVQQKLYEEVSQFEKELNGNRLNYDTLAKMKYLEQCVSETLRKWPPAQITDRECTQDCVLDYDDRKLTIKKGTNIWIPIVSLHRDPKYFPEPDKYDPDRFSDENKHLIQQGSYLPFGIGPRNCIGKYINSHLNLLAKCSILKIVFFFFELIGSRFALMDAKALIYYLVLNFEIHAYKKTQIPLKMMKQPFAWFPEKGIHLELKPRKVQ